jgi:hypothetical protein
MLLRNIRGPFAEKGYVAVGPGLQRGVLLVVVPGATDNTKAQIASAVGQGRYRGIQIDEGYLPGGVADPTIPDLITAQKQGIAMALVPAGSSGNEGDQAWCNAQGQFISRVPSSFSGFILGQFDQTFQAGANPQYEGIEMFPQHIETVRSVTQCNSGAIGQGTKFVQPGFVAPGAAQVPLYRARYTGETLRNLALTLKVAPAGADSVTAFFVRSQDGGNTWTALNAAGNPQVVVTGTAIAGANLTDTFVLTAGDLVGVALVSTNVTAAQPTVTFDVA